MTNKVLITWSVICLVGAGYFETQDSVIAQRKKMLQDIGKGDVLGWARHLTGQDVNDPNDYDSFKSIAVVPGNANKPSGEANVEDNVYVVVERELPGTPVVYNYPVLRIADGTFAARQTDPGLAHTTAVADVNDLQNINNNLAGNYYLTGNIDASATASWNGGAGFEPLGENGGTQFTGTFDGCGYTITGLTINRPTEWGVGLFSSVQNCTIANVTLADVTVTGITSVGCLVGEALWVLGDPTGTVLIQNCHVTGTSSASLAGTHFGWVGGLIGSVSGDISGGYICDVYDCRTNATVDVSNITGSAQGIGGFCGMSDNGGRFYNCRATGTVTGDGSWAGQLGGFVGMPSGQGLWQDCAATGNVTMADSDAGGFCGDASDVSFTRCSARGHVTSTYYAAGFASAFDGCTVTDCYAWGNTTADYYQAGFSDYVYNNSTLTNTYSIGTCTGGLMAGLVRSKGTATATSSYWDTEASGQASSALGTGKTTAQMKTQSTYSGWDFTTVWRMPSTGGPVTVKQVEMFTPVDWGSDPNYCWFVDCAAYGNNLYQPGSETPAIPEAWSSSDDSELDGEEVCVYADGVPQGTFTMDGNDIADFNEADYTVIIDGLNYYSIYESLPLTKDRTRIINVAIDFYETLGAHVGTTRTYSDDWQFSADSFATQLDPVTEIKFGTFPRGWAGEPVLYIHEWDPVPLCIRGMYPTMEVPR